MAASKRLNIFLMAIAPHGAVEVHQMATVDLITFQIIEVLEEMMDGIIFQIIQVLVLSIHRIGTSTFKEIRSDRAIFSSKAFYL